MEKIISHSNLNLDKTSKTYSGDFQLVLSEILSTNGILETIENKSMMLDYIISTNGIEKSNEEFHIVSILKKILKDYEYLYNLYENGIINIFDIICIGMIQEKKLSFIKDKKYLLLLKDVVKKCKLPFVVENEEGVVVFNKAYEKNNLNSINYECIKTFQIDNKYYNIFGLDINEIVGKLYNIIMNLNSASTPKDALQILFAEINKIVNVDRISFAQISKGENIELSSIGDYCASHKPNPIGETSKRILNEQSILFKAISNGEIIITNDIQSWAVDKFISKGVEIPRFTAEIMKAGYKSVMTIPIIDNGNPLGIIFLNSNSKDSFSQFDIEKIQNITGTIVFGVTNIIKMKIMQEVSLRDQLTQLYNRTYLEKWIHEYTINQKKKFESGIHHCGVFIHMDLDHFKQVNDTYGHDAGDEVLRQVSKTITNTLRAQDMVIRT
ncbi:MAG: sensor domain-containing diguanylate cyclase, partial [Candidatus Absconditabacteria bacterium]